MGETIEPFSKEDHDRHWPKHSGSRGHYCLDWDQLWICEDCQEFECCSCDLEEPESDELKTALPIVQNCDGCSACCRHMRQPPFIIVLDDDGRAISEKPGDEWCDLEAENFNAMPAVARHEYWERHESDAPEECPCVWLDEQNNRCRFHEHRPGICRDFEIGSEECLNHRRDNRAEIAGDELHCAIGNAVDASQRGHVEARYRWRCLLEVESTVRPLLAAKDEEIQKLTAEVQRLKTWNANEAKLAQQMRELVARLQNEIKELRDAK
jgi:uncharacterized protein